MRRFESVAHNLDIQNTGTSSLWLPLCSAASCQILKGFFSVLKGDPTGLRAMLQSGGMPSAHTAMVASLLTDILCRYGIRYDAFPIAVVLALIVMHDASGVRQEAGRHAKVINWILRYSSPPHNGVEFFEDIGHTKPQVAVGALIGIGVTLFFHHRAKGQYSVPSQELTHMR